MAMTTCTNHTAARQQTKGTAHDWLSPPRSLSVKTWENAGFTKPMAEVMAEVRATNSRAASAPWRRLSAKSHTEADLPPGSNASVGTKSRQIPVNAWSKRSSLTATSPRAGSLRYTLPRLKPRTTTKWLNSQWTMHGKWAEARSCSGS